MHAYSPPAGGHKGRCRDDVRPRYGRLATMVALAGLMLFQQHAAASSIERRSLSDLAKSAETIFEGTVVSSNVVPGVDNKPPHTCLTFTVTDVIAGKDPGKSLVLCFLGGEVNGQRTVVSDMTYPVVGEHGIYLAESTSQAMVNPLIGWDQGRFLVEKDTVTGTEKVLTSHRHPVLRLGQEARLPTTDTTLVTSEGTAAGVVAGSGPDMTGAMGSGDFKAWLKSVR